MPVQNAALIAATIATGLLAGTFYGFACSVMIALRRVDDHTFVEVMRKINAAIQNGWFMLSFLGAPVFTVLAGILRITGTGWSSQLLVLVIALVFNMAALVVTFGINIPLNVQLDRAGRHEQTARQHFESAWTRWNIVRALLATVALGLLCWALELTS